MIMEMKVDEKKIVRTHLDRIEVQVGDKGVIEPQGGGDHFNTRFVGWDQDHFLILKLPPRSEVGDSIYQGKELIVRYLDCRGRICGFRTTVQGMMYRPQRVVFVDFPAEMEILSLRRSDRVECFIPAGLQYSDQPIKCAIIDISPTGCKLSLAAADESPEGGLAAEAEFSLDFVLLGFADEPIQAACLIRSRAVKNEMLVLGIEFKEIGESARKRIDDYVHQVTAFMELSCPLGPNLLRSPPPSPSQPPE